MAVTDQSKGRMEKRLFGLTGLSNSGKTTLMEDLISWFRLEGMTVSTIKHAHHEFDLDQPGKDSYRMREAGAHEVLLVGGNRSVLMHEYRDAGEPLLEHLVERLAPCDIVFVEGYKNSAIPKIEVYRPSLGRAPVWPENATIIAVASDEAIDCPLPALDLNDGPAIAEHIHQYLFGVRRGG
jgi:molybdopterin-guanine dinucleotide biosynthesis protein B